MVTLKQNINMRDAWLYQSALEMKLGGKQQNNDGTEIATTPMVRLHLLNRRALPTRFQLTEDEIDFQMIDLMCKTKRELLKETFQKWQKTDMNISRGTIMPKISKIENKIRLSYQCSLDIIKTSLENENGISEAKIREKLIVLLENIGMKITE